MSRITVWVASMRRAFGRSDELDAAMREEMGFHIDMEAERLMRERGLDEHEARRQACIAFGGVEKYKEEGRDTHRAQWIAAASLDARLAVRMLVRHRWLTVVGGFAMALAIAIGATFFEVISQVLNPALPFPDGERLVALRNVASDTGAPDRRVLHDFLAWRDRLMSVEDIGAFRTVQHNLISGNASPESIKVAEITASGFVVAGTQPSFGRYLHPADEQPGAQPVVVIGHQAWRSRFGGDAQIIGRTMKLGGITHSIVGVMPERFKFPVDHQFWIALRVNPLQYEPDQGPQLYVFGRLARGASLATAQAELTSFGARSSTAYAATRDRLRPSVVPFTREHLDLGQPSLVLVLRVGQILIGALTFVVAMNLAILVYARTVARLGEIAVRTALGASRRRILMQLFIEALALCLVGAVAGLALAAVTLDRIQMLLPSNGSVPFWLDFGVSAVTVVYALGLATMASVVVGVLPGLKATSGNLNTQLRELSARTGTRMGRAWAALVVAQVAVAAAVLPVAVFMSWQLARMELAGPGFAAERILVAVAAMPDEPAARDASRVRARQLDLISRLESEPGVASVVVSSSIPGFGGDRQIQIDDPTLRDQTSAEVSTVNVDVNLFHTYGIPMRAGRSFTAADLGAAYTAIVNRSFAEQFASGRTPLGLRFRYLGGRTPAGTDTTASYQIVGVVNDFPSFPSTPGSRGSPTVYHAMAAGDGDTVALSVRFNGNIPAGFMDRFRVIGAEVDPALQLRRVVPLADFYGEVRSLWRFIAWGIALVTSSVLLLSAAGIYALMSFAVAQRTREIGIRSALGAAPHRLLLSVFGPATRQLAVGVVAGSLLSGLVLLSIDVNLDETANLLIVVAGIMMAVGLLAAAGPARRSLRMSATDALRADG